MEIVSNIDLVNDTYTTQVGIRNITPREEELLRKFGPKSIEVGGTITGSLTRPGDSAPTLQIVSGTSGGGINATFTPIIVNGVITDVSITNVGQGYTGTPLLEAVGGSHGSGFTAQLVVDTNSPYGITSVIITNGGSNYRTNPTSVTITLPEEQRIVDWGFPVKKVFSKNDYFNADLMAKLYKDTIESRIVSLKADLEAEESNFLGTTVTTI